MTCADGTTGRRVAARLAGRGVPTRLGSRTCAPPFDRADERTWAAALDGTRAAYRAYHPDVTAPVALGRVRGFAEQAARCYLRVVLSPASFALLAWSLVLHGCTDAVA